jgi:LCP family protein required for cell wall assembly
MRRSFLSLALGGSLGLMACAFAFVLFSLVQPGWLRKVFASAAHPPPPGVSAPSPATPVPGGTLPPVSEADPTPEPLPTASTPNACAGPEHITLALLGVDDREEGYERATRTDAISLVNVNFTNQSAAMFSIPRDLYVALPNLAEVGIEADRINTAYLYGEVYGVEGGGPAELKEAIELNFGIRVDRYVMVNFGAFEAAVDALGGIDIDVPKAIYDPNFPADDGSGRTVVFELPAGWQHLDGRTALRYARTRHQDDDYHRVQRQQQVLLAIRDKLLSPDVIPHLPDLLNRLSGLIRTDLSPQELAMLACIGPQIDRAAIEAYAIDGTMVIPWTTPNGGRVSVPDRDAIAPLVQEFLGP